MSAALPVHRSRTEQPDVHLVHETRRPQGVTGTFLAHVMGGDATQLGIDEREQLLPGGVVAVPQLADEQCQPGLPVL